MASAVEDMKPAAPAQPLASTSTAAAGATDASGDVKMDGPADGAGDATGSAAEGDKEDDGLGPDGLPRDATETLYIQNLNEKVKMPGASPSSKHHHVCNP